jgi:alanine racemase
MFTIDEIADITEGRLLSRQHHAVVSEVATDSRQLALHPGVMFVAIAGSYHDGHQFIPELYGKGVRHFLVEHERNLSKKMLTDCSVVCIPRSGKALQKLAAAHRERYHIPVVGITGSNGKTIIKEWLFQLLSPDLRITKSPRSYNSQLGVPLSVLRLEANHELAIFEAGISMPGEMRRLHDIIKPTIGIFTNIGSAHDEGFTSREQKVQEKWHLFDGADLVIFCKDHAEIEQYKTATTGATLSWGRHPASDVVLREVQKQGEGSRVVLQAGHQHIDLLLPFQDAASVENALHCAVLMLHLKVPLADIQKRLQSLRKIPMRLELKHGVNNCYLINDAYNNDLAGLEVALGFLEQQPTAQKRAVILSDILQSGIAEAALYKKIDELLWSRHVDHLVGIGAAITRHAHSFRLPGRFFENTEAFLASKPERYFSNEAILIKGARPFGFEKITRALEQKIHGTVLEINLDAIVHNLNYYRRHLQKGVKTMAMVKALAYGSGSNEVAGLLQYHQVEYFGIAYPDEGIRLRHSGITRPIMVMNASVDTFPALLQYALEPEIFSLSQLMALQAFLKDRKATMKIHIKLDTGMHRLGFEAEHMEALAGLLRKTPEVQVASIYTHLAAADDPQQDDFTHRQLRYFSEHAHWLSDKLKIAPMLHALNSAGILRFPQYHFGMVRLGIGLYGHEPSGTSQHGLRAISTLKTVVSQVKHLKAGDSVGYGRRAILASDSVIATIAIGYADGFSRAFGNGKASVYINGHLAPVVGNVCMDMTMIDVTGVEVAEGDEVIVFGELPSIETLAQSINTIPYEILTNVSERVRRVFFAE